MSTRSAIIERTENGTYRGIYCHLDGYCTGVGQTLLSHYKDAAKVASLIKLGDVSSLGERVEPVGYHSFNQREDGTTVAYIRDRGESGCEARTGATSQAVADRIGHNGYVYVFENNEWTCNGVPLEVAVQKEL